MKKNQAQSNAVGQTLESLATDLDNESSSSEIDETEKSDSDTNESGILDIANVQNPSYVVGKGRPSKRRYQSSIEQERKQQKQGGGSIRKSYKCGLCGQTGHNAAFHKGKSENCQTRTRSRQKGGRGRGIK